MPDELVNDVLDFYWFDVDKFEKSYNVDNVVPSFLLLLSVSRCQRKKLPLLVCPAVPISTLIHGCMQAFTGFGDEPNVYLASLYRNDSWVLWRASACSCAIPSPYIDLHQLIFENVRVNILDTNQEPRLNSSVYICRRISVNWHGDKNFIDRCRTAEHNCRYILAMKRLYMGPYILGMRGTRSSTWARKTASQTAILFAFLYDACQGRVRQCRDALEAEASACLDGLMTLRNRLFLEIQVESNYQEITTGVHSVHGDPIQLCFVIRELEILKLVGCNSLALSAREERALEWLDDTVSSLECNMCYTTGCVICVTTS